MSASKLRSYPLLGETLAFTGQLGISRNEAVVLAEKAGAHIQSGVTTDTTILILGSQSASKLGAQSQSSKHRKAEALIASGQNIRIIGEAEFIALLGTFPSEKKAAPDVDRSSLDRSAYRLTQRFARIPSNLEAYRTGMRDAGRAASRCRATCDLLLELLQHHKDEGGALSRVSDASEAERLIDFLEGRDDRGLLQFEPGSAEFGDQLADHMARAHLPWPIFLSLIEGLVHVGAEDAPVTADLRAALERAWVAAELMRRDGLATSDVIAKLVAFADEPASLPTNETNTAKIGNPEFLISLGISSRSDGRWYCRGFSFPAAELAVEFAEQKIGEVPTTALAVSKNPDAGDWISQATTLQIGNLEFAAKFVYCGNKPPGRDAPNNSYIDARLEVSSYFADPMGETLTYYPSYAGMMPTARRSYLTWLAEGRKDPSTPIGYVFLFFYGLEHRLILGNDPDDIAPISAEVRRLLQLYGDNHSFRIYAERLLEVADTMRADQAAPLLPSPDLRNGYEIPLRVKMHLGKLVSESRSLDAANALIWVLSLPDSYLRTPARRCFPELVELWMKRFPSSYPDGLMVKAPKAKICHGYRAASANFYHEISIGDLPDIGHVEAPLRGLRALLAACVDALDPLSRFLGKEPGARGTVAAALLAPEEIRDHVGAHGLADCRSGIENRVDARGAGLFTVAELMKLLQIDSLSDSKIPVPVQRQMSSALDALDYGFEPDRRYGTTATMLPENKLVVFPAVAGAPVDVERAEFAAARTMAEIYALAALSDGLVVPDELAVIERDLLAIPGLGAQERDRILARCLALLEDPPRRREAMKRLTALPETHRRQVTQASITIILADGQVTPAEVKFLESLHEALDLPKEEVYVALHRQQSAPDDMLVTVIADDFAAGTPLPAVDGPLAIDSTRLARIRGETAAVSQLLAGIFVEEDEEVVTTPSAPMPSAGRFAGLDAAHGEMLWAVMQGGMDRAGFEASARTAGLMPDGAIETINEWAFDMFDEPAIEDDGAIVVVDYLVPELIRIGATH